MTRQERLHKIELFIKKMPVLPVTVTKVKEICDNPKTSPVDLHKVISLDPVLMGKVMKLINSAYYGYSGKVTSLVRAIIMLGMNTVKNLALSATVMGLVNQLEHSSLNSIKQFWQHSLCTGIAVKLLAKDKGLDRNTQEEYFVAGMLHDIGKIPIMSCFPEEYNRLTKECDSNAGRCLYMEEKEIFEIDHSIAGEMIAELWNLENQIRQVISYHHITDSRDIRYKDLVYTVAIADYFTNINGYGFNCKSFREVPDSILFEKTGITIEMLENIKGIVADELEKAKEFLDFKEGVESL